jgi:hypothetical protein
LYRSGVGVNCRFRHVVREREPAFFPLFVVAVPVEDFFVAPAVLWVEAAVPFFAVDFFFATVAAPTNPTAKPSVTASDKSLRIFT